MSTPFEPHSDDALSLEELLAGVDPDSTPDGWSPGDLSRMSIEAFTRQRIAPPAHRGIGKLKLSGPPVVAHTAPIAETSRLLAALQKAVTYVTASVRQGSSRPVITGVIRQGTALLLTPNFAPGSLEISVVSRQPEASEPALVHPASEVDVGIRTLVELFEAARFNEDLPGGLIDRLRTLGPRTARTLLSLSDTVLDDDLRLDITWRTTDHANLRGTLGRSQATAIRQAIHEGRIEVERITLVGFLRTISQIPHVPLDLILESGQRVQLKASEEQRAGLGPLYDNRVTVVADESVQTSARGEGKRQYELISVRAFEPGDSSAVFDEVE